MTMKAGATGAFLSGDARVKPGHDGRLPCP